MFDHFKNRMAQRGENMSEMLRMQSNMVIEQTWDRDPNYRSVYVVKVNHGLPEVTPKHELIDAKFNVDTYQKADSNEPAYHLQFRHGAEKLNSDIGVGSYVYMKDEDVKNAIDAIEAEMAGSGRVLIRPSGTEPLVRVMIEGNDIEKIQALAQQLADLIESKFA